MEEETTLEQALSVPELFISYSWSSETHKVWVEKLAGSLRQQRIKVVFDRWDLSAGDLTRKFMQLIRTSDKILIVCDQDYCNKLDDPSSSVAKEYHLIENEKFNNFDSKKVLVATVQMNRNGEPCVPRDYREELPLDMTDDSKFKENVKTITRWVYGIEKNHLVGSEIPCCGQPKPDTLLSTIFKFYRCSPYLRIRP